MNLLSWLDSGGQTEHDVTIGFENGVPTQNVRTSRQNLDTAGGRAVAPAAEEGRGVLGWLGKLVGGWRTKREM